jgi:hypothetical protein
MRARNMASVWAGPAPSVGKGGGASGPGESSLESLLLKDTVRLTVHWFSATREPLLTPSRGA